MIMDNKQINKDDFDRLLHEKIKFYTTFNPELVPGLWVAIELLREV